MLQKNTFLAALCLICALFTAAPIFAQKWFIPGDRWAYNVTGGFIGIDTTIYLENTGDTILGGRVCQKIVSNGFPNDRYLRCAYGTENQLFVWNRDNGQFSMIYDFSKNVGDSVVIYDAYSGQLPVTRYRIIATGSVQAAGVQRRYQDVQLRTPYNTWSTFNYTIIEGIGLVGNPVSSEYVCSYLFLDETPYCGAVADGFDYRFECFAGNLGVYSTNGGTCSPSDTDQQLASLSIWPNPARTALTVQLPPSITGATATLVNTLGQPVRTWNTLDAPLQVGDVPTGMYFLNVEIPTIRQRVLRKIVIAH
jgi:Secretion system C-terminal sorting domain